MLKSVAVTDWAHSAGLLRSTEALHEKIWPFEGLLQSIVMLRKKVEPSWTSAALQSGVLWQGAVLANDKQITAHF